MSDVVGDTYEVRPAARAARATGLLPRAAPETNYATV